MLKTRLTLTGSTFFLTASNDLYVGKSLEVYGEWSHGEVDALAALLKADDNIIEVGANIGSHTVFLARDICPSGKVFAFEPRRILFQMLCANIALNGLENVHAWQLGAGDVNETLREGCMRFDGPLNAGGLKVGSVEGDTEELAIVRIDDKISAHEKVALIKADVEGYEYRVLLGAGQTIKRERPILYLENDRVEQSPELLGHLFDIGYDVWWHRVPLFRKNNKANTAANIFGNILSFNILCFPKERGVTVNGLDRVVDPLAHPLKNG